MGRGGGDLSTGREREGKRKMAQERRKNPISDSLITAEVFIKLPGDEVGEDKRHEI